MSALQRIITKQIFGICVSNKVGACTPTNTNKSRTHHLVLSAPTVWDLFDSVKIYTGKILFIERNCYEHKSNLI